MQKIQTLVFICGMSLFAMAANAQKNIPQKVLDHFNSKYPNAQVHDWDKEDNGYEVEFRLDGKKWDGYYNTSGEWVKSERDVTRNQVPKAVWNALAKSDYTAWRTDDIEEHQTPAHNTVYEIELKNQGKEAYVYFLPDGTMVK